MRPGRTIIPIVLSAAAMLLILSCASLSSSGVGRIKHYVVESDRLPVSFDGYSVAFISDIHYPSLFTHKRLAKLVRKLRNENPDMLLLGGDYVTDNSYISELFDSLSTVHPSDGTFAVLGNHARRNSALVADAMAKCGIELLCDDVVYVTRDGSSIALFGVEDSFAYDTLAVASTGVVSDSLFTVLLCHTPDYAEQTSATADLVLSGHTHGGQVTLMGIYTPVKNSVYGSVFCVGATVHRAEKRS
jgi:predicted MPP superfamily phosphohydrolase